MKRSIHIRNAQFNWNWSLSKWQPIYHMINLTWTDPYQNDSQFTTWLSYNLLYHARRNTNTGHKLTLAMISFLWQWCPLVFAGCLHCWRSHSWTCVLRRMAAHDIRDDENNNKTFNHTRGWINSQVSSQIFVRNP